MKRMDIWLATAILLLMACQNNKNENLLPVDASATQEVVELYRFLKQMPEGNFLLGQHEPNFRGLGWLAEDSVADMFKVSGKHPAIFGYDFSWINSSAVDKYRRKILEAYEMGAIITMSYHMGNPLTGKGVRDTVETVKYLLPGAKAHGNYKKVLDEVAEFTKSLVDSAGKPVPVIFRPFHEFNGHWFWWGQPYSNAEDFKALWQFTVDYLRDEKGMHQFLYAFSPDTTGSLEAYFERYPGDDYVDIIGMDIYRDVEENDLEKYIRHFKLTVEAANSRGKIPAITETGYANHSVKDWYTNFFLKAWQNDEVTRQIKYMVLWANYRNDMYWSIYPGHFNVPDFINFEQHEATVFLPELKQLRLRQ